MDKILFQIIDDALKLASASQLNFERALHIIQYLQYETDGIPWRVAFDNFNFIRSRFKSNEAHIFEVSGSIVRSIVKLEKVN